jgi:hypothetical protein
MLLVHMFVHAVAEYTNSSSGAGSAAATTLLVHRGVPQHWFDGTSGDGGRGFRISNVPVRLNNGKIVSVSTAVTSGGNDNGVKAGNDTLDGRVDGKEQHTCTLTVNTADQFNPNTKANTTAKAIHLTANDFTTDAAPPSQSRGPCDIFDAAGTPCVAAHSTVRALYAGYTGPLYTVQLSTDHSRTTPLTPRSMLVNATQSGFADSAAQDAFCGAESCVISRIFDQSGNQNHLDTAPAGTVLVFRYEFALKGA